MRAKFTYFLEIYTTCNIQHLTCDVVFNQKLYKKN